MGHLSGGDPVIIKRASADFFRMSSRWAVSIVAVLLTAGFLLVVDCTDDLEAASEGKIGSLYYKMDDQGNLEFWGSGVIPDKPEWDVCTTVTVKNEGISIGNYAFQDCDGLTTVSIQGSVGSIGNNAFYACGALKTVTIDGSVGSIGDYAFLGCAELNTVTMTGPITSIESHAFQGCFKLQTLNIACNDPLNITKGNIGNGYIAVNADIVNHIHRYSAAYDWADDGSSCTVHINCLNDSALIHDDHPEVSHTVKIQPTETDMGTTEYSVSGTYDGFAYSDTKDVQDIPATGGDPYDPGDKTSSYNRFPALALTLSVLSCLGMVGAVVLLGRRTV